MFLCKLQCEPVHYAGDDGRISPQAIKISTENIEDIPHYRTASIRPSLPLHRYQSPELQGWLG